MGETAETLETESGKLFETGEGLLFGCGGNACDVIRTRQVNIPDTQLIAQFYCSNPSQKTVNVTFKWVNMMGGTGPQSRATIAPGQEVSFDLQGLYILGHYSSAASYA